MRLQLPGQRIVLLLMVNPGGSTCLGVSSDSDTSEPPGEFQQDLLSSCQDNSIALGCSGDTINYAEL